MIRQPLKVVRRSDRMLLAAELCAELSPEDLDQLEEQWKPQRSQLKQMLIHQGVPKAEWPESLHWNWSRKSSQLRMLAYQAWSICRDDRYEAVMLTMSAGHVSRHSETMGKPLIYVDYLETAPWNWRIPQLQQQGKLSGLGSLMLRAAILQSAEEGFQGRVGLHALPQAESFYAEVCGMSALGEDSTYQNLHYFEFTREQAMRFLA